MDKVKYLASYSGPSYGSMTQYHMDAFSSLKAVMESMWRRQRHENDFVELYTEDEFGVHRLDVDGGGYTVFPACTPEDYMDVYYAVPEDGGYILGEWGYRITVGPRGGIRAEKA